MANPPPVFLRQQLLIDGHVQGSLLKRTALYSLACAIYFVVILVFTESMSRQDGNLGDAMLRCLDEAIYWAPGLFLLAPLIAYDMLKLTNRFAGPIFGLRREMQRLIAGESERPLNFRDGDHWSDLAVGFNQIREELMTLREENLRLNREGAPINATPDAAVAPVAKLFGDLESDESDELDLLASIGG